MATSIDTPVQTQYVDFDEYIDFQLQKTRTNVKWTDVLTAAVGVSALVVGYLLVFVVFDHWVIPGGFSQTARLVMLGVLLAVSIGWIAWKIVIPYVRRVNGLYAARLIEQSSPELRSTLLNLVDLRRAGRPIPEDIRSALEKRAAVTLSKIDVDQAVDRRPLMRAAYVLLAVVVLACAYTLFTPKKITSSIWRALVPTAATSVSTRTEILEVRPGDVEVLARAQLEVTADLRGEIPERVRLYFTTADRKYVDEAVEMRPLEDGVKQFRGLIAGENGRGILQDMTYRIEAGDAVTRDFQITVKQPPSARVDSVQYQYPSYMEFANKTEPSGHIDAYEGTTVVVTATANMPVKSALLLFSDTEDTSLRAEEIRMEITDGTKLRAEWKLGFREDGTYPHFYRIQCRNDAGETDPQPTLYNVTIRPDQPPEIALVDPTGDLLKPANAIVPLMIVARDPDFKLRFLNLRVEKNGEPVGDEEIWTGSQQAYSGTYEFRLEPRNLKVGDIVTYWVEARDNRQPDGNRKNTPKLKIEIIEPVSEKEVERQLQEDRQKQEEKLNEARENQNPEDMPEEPPQDGEQPREQRDQENAGEQAGEPRNGEGQPQQKNGEGQSQNQTGEQGTDSGENGQPSNSANGGQGEQRRDGASDQEALRRLIEQERRRQQEENAGNESPENGKPGDNQQPSQDPNSGNKQESSNQKADDKGKQSDTGEPKPDQNGMSKQNGSDKSQDSQNGDGRPMPSDDPNGEKGSKPAGDPKNGDGGQPGDPMPGDQNGEPSASDNGNQKSKPKDGPGRDDQKGKQPNDGAADSKNAEPKEGPEGGSDEGQSGGMPSDGDNPSSKSKPGGEGDTPRSPNGMKKDTPDSNVKNGEERPADDTGDAQRREATGDEKGTATPDNDPNADPKRAKNKLDRKEGTEPGPRQRGDDPSNANPSRTEPGDPRDRPQNPDGARENGMRENPDADPKRARPGEKNQPPNERGAPGDPKDTDPDRTGNDPKNAGDQPGGEPDPNGRPGDKKGMPGEKSQNGQPGESSDDSGNAEQKSGDPKNSGEGTGKSNDQKGSGKPSSADTKKGSDSKNGEPADGESDGQSGSQSNKPGQQSGKGASKGQTGTGAESDSGNRGGANQTDGSSGEGTGGADGGGDEVNLEDAKKAANLVLDRLNERLERGEVDQKLLDELGWTEADMRKFAERLGQQLDAPSADENSPRSEAERRQFEEMLKSLPLKSGASRRQGSAVENRGPDGGIAAPRLPVPAEYREAYEAYTRSLSKRTTQPAEK